ncbi:MAG: peptidylprolyl isomerase [Sedimentitalea sp.]
MPKGLTFLSSLAVAAALSFPVPALAEPDASTVVARVNGTEITLGHVIVAHATLPQQYKELPAEVLYEAIIDQLVQQSTLDQAFDQADPMAVRLSLENERRSLRAAEEIERIMAAAASESDIQASYTNRYSEGFGGMEFNASHILVETEEEAKAIKADIDDGADFATMAREKSTGPSGPGGGALGWFGKGAMVPEFETAVVAMSPGDVSDPVQTQFGWHLIRLKESRQTTAPELAEVRAEIANELRQAAVESKIEELTADAEIERVEIEDLAPEIIRNVDLLRN